MNPWETIPATMRAAVLFGAGDVRVVDKPVPVPGLARCW